MTMMTIMLVAGNDNGDNNKFIMTIIFTVAMAITDKAESA